KALLLLCVFRCEVLLFILSQDINFTKHAKAQCIHQNLTNYIIWPKFILQNTIRLYRKLR
ncbi:MAG TPA: hypothetical protein PLS08_03545, partial [Chryseolinea sp.]|nr:hypothetical protein [Chryseolinea sp.]